MKPEQAKPSYGGKTSEQPLLLEEKERRLIGKRFQETLLEDSNVLCLDRYLGSTGTFMCQNHLMLHLKTVHFIAHKFYKKKRTVNKMNSCLCMHIAVDFEMHEKMQDGWMDGWQERWMYKEMVDRWICNQASRIKQNFGNQVVRMRVLLQNSTSYMLKRSRESTGKIEVFASRNCGRWNESPAACHLPI